MNPVAPVRIFRTLLGRAQASKLACRDVQRGDRRDLQLAAEASLRRVVRTTSKPDKWPALLRANERNRYAIARCAGRLTASIATGESIDYGEGRAVPNGGGSHHLLRPLSISYDAGRADRQPLLGVRL
jgi:hypothetical protein